MYSVVIIVQLLVFCAVVIMTIATIREIERRQEQRRRLGGENIVGEKSVASLWAARITDNAFTRWILASTSISDPEERQKLRQALLLAGYESPNAPIWYVIIRFSLAILLPVIFLVTKSISGQSATGFGAMLWPLLLCGAGLFIPSRVLAHLASSRQTELEFEFPDALDLMVVCVEAGLSLDAAFIRVGREVSESHPRIALEFERVSEQLRAGRTRTDALRSMSDRTGVNAIKSFVALVIQTEILGAGIAQTLRIFSAEMRTSRFIRAEEKAMRVPVLMTIPLVLCILPVIVTAALLPAFLDIVRTVMPALAHPGVP